MSKRTRVYMLYCEARGCPLLAEYAINIDVRPFPPIEGFAPMITFAELLLCDKCAGAATIDDVLTPELWSNIKTVLRNAKIRPDKRGCSIFLMPLHSPAGQLVARFSGYAKSSEYTH